MGELVSIKDKANKAVRESLQRQIATAFFEGATSLQIVTALEKNGLPTAEAEKQVAKVRALNNPKCMKVYEYNDFGGRNGFRAQFGLEPTEAKLPIPLDFPLTESGDAELFAETYGAGLRYDHLRERWLLSDDESGLWLPDLTCKVGSMALDTVRERQRRAINIEEHEPRKRMLDWSIAGESRSRLTNLIHLAKDKPPLSDDGRRWDMDPWLLGTLNGRIDLRTGEFRRADPEERITQQVRVAFDPHAKCPLWEATLRAIFAGHRVEGDKLLDQLDTSESDRVVAFMQRALGYSMTGVTTEECCFFTWGEGSNGKGTIINTLGCLFGDYTDDMPYTTLEKNLFKSQGIPNDVAKMAGKRFITCSEVNEFTLNESRLKALTGRDPITARFLNHEYFTFEMQGKIWIATNNKPKIVGIDDGIWRRIFMIPFTNKFAGSNLNNKLKDQLRLELPGIFNWLIRGALEWQRIGLDPPETVRAATESYRQESEPLNDFVEACLVSRPNSKLKAAQAWEAYSTWARANVEYPLTNKAFFKSMRRRYQVVESRAGAHYEGVGLLSQGGQGGDVPF